MTRAPGPFSLRDLTEPSRFKNQFAPIRLLRIFILQLLRGDFCNTIGTQRPCRQSPHMSAIEGRPAVLSRCREFSLRPEAVI